jgi:hypothetical protein
VTLLALPSAAVPGSPRSFDVAYMDRERLSHGPGISHFFTGAGWRQFSQAHDLKTGQVVVFVRVRVFGGAGARGRVVLRCVRIIRKPQGKA